LNGNWRSRKNSEATCLESFPEHDFVVERGTHTPCDSRVSDLLGYQSEDYVGKRNFRKMTINRGTGGALTKSTSSSRSSDRRKQIESQRMEAAHDASLGQQAFDAASSRVSIISVRDIRTETK